MKKDKKKINKETAIRVNKERKKQGKKYRKHGLIYNSTYYNTLKYLLETKKKEYCYSDLSPHINQNTWETKLKKFLKDELQVINGEKRGRVFYFSFDERKFLMYLFDEFINYLLEKLFAIRPAVMQLYTNTSFIGSKINKKLGYFNNLDKEIEVKYLQNIPIETAEIENFISASKMLKSQLNQLSDMKDKSFKKHFKIPQDSPYISTEWEHTLYGVTEEEVILVDFFKKLYTPKLTNLFVNPKGTKKEYETLVSCVSATKKQVKDRIIIFVNVCYPKIFENFEYLFKNLIKTKRYKALCDSIEDIILNWSKELESLCDESNLFYSLHKYNPQYKNKKACSSDEFKKQKEEDLMFLIFQLCYIVRKIKENKISRRGLNLHQSVDSK